MVVGFQVSFNILYILGRPQLQTNLFAVLRVGEVNEVVIVHFLGVDDIAVLLLTQILGVNAIGSQELLVSYAERLPDGLSDKLGLQAGKAGIMTCLRWSHGGLFVYDSSPSRIQTTM